MQGLTIHSTEISGSTLYLPHPEILPLVDLPILGAIHRQRGNGDDNLAALFELAARSRAEAPACVQLEVEDRVTIKALGERLSRILAGMAIPPTRRLVLLAAGNFGKTLGQYVTRWGQADTSIIVIDEVPSASRPILCHDQ